MLTVLSIFGIYLAGVLVALLVIAWANTHGFFTGGDEIPSVIGCLSWIAVFVAMIVFIAYPFSLFYDWCYAKFEKLMK